MFSKILNFLYGLKWLARGCPMLHYKGYHCGCCGHWVAQSFVIPDFISMGEWWDTWGLCPEGEGCRKEERKINVKKSYSKTEN